ncbi:MAG: hypothetical protein EOO40_03100 [Deltaproteobacteria bacterium]|nr:MAG: hypothetical protein EOO40_03100 [Deltaproteobacteria bacterium]
MKASNTETRSAASKGAQERLTGHFEEVYDEATELGEALQAAAEDARAFVRLQATTRPYVTLGVAASAGFVLAGGLSPKVGAMLVKMGGRLLANRLLGEVAKLGGM